MIWKLNNAGQYETDNYLIEHLPTRNAAKPYFLYIKVGMKSKQWFNFITNSATLDIAKHAAVNNAAAQSE